MKVDKRIIALIMAMSIGTSNIFARQVTDEMGVEYNYSVAETKTQKTKTQSGAVLRNVNLRTKPNKTTSKIIRLLKVGEKVKIVGKSGNFYKIEYKKNTFGYAYGGSYIKIGEDKPSDSKPDQSIQNKVGIVTGSVNVRTSPNSSIDTNKIGKLSKNTKIEIIGLSGDFYKIKYEGQYAYASKYYISATEGLKLDKIDEIKLKKDVIVRDLASDTSEKLCTLEAERIVYVVEKLENDWYKIELKNGYGYVKIEKEPEVKNIIGVSTKNVNIRTSPDTSTLDNKIGVLKIGTKIEIAGEDREFYKVKYKGQYAYISKLYLSPDKNLKLDKVGELKITQDAQVRDLSSEDSPVLFTLEKDNAVNVIERFFNGWYKIEINNVYGYVKPTDGELINSEKDINLIKNNSHYYYINPDGTKFKGYKVVDGVEYYFSNETGESIDKFVIISEKENGKTITNRYFVKENGGIVKNEFKKVVEMSNKTYYFGEDGKAVRGIKNIKGKNYYFNTRYSYIMTGLCSVNENIYYFNKSSFVMETNTSKTVAGKLKVSIGSDGKVYKMEKIDKSDLANMLYSGFSKMGTPYSHNYEEGLNCSNYVTTILKEIGLNTFSDDERTSHQQALYCEKNNLNVDKKSLQPGDILFYNNINCSKKKKYGYCERELENGMHIHHVAIYIGDGKIIESTSSVNSDYENAGVRIYNLNSQSKTYYVYSAARVLYKII